MKRAQILELASKIESMPAARNNNRNLGNFLQDGKRVFSG